jgi:RNA polymerase sigma-70 factor (ECF subfamily)
MRHFEHLSNSEVAQALALSEPAAGMRYLRAMRKLRALLDDKSAPGSTRLSSSQAAGGPAS